ncbi:MAG TPA: hypothetical protein VMU61_04550 [Candidatus Aquilonibacter sp.]|nr:hypothetical protein [Candidatus Aquilonibacter sp.]
MLFILRLSNGDCVVALATDASSARETAANLDASGSFEVASVRPLSRFAVRLSPTEDASLEAAQWEDGTLDDILMSEYPLLNEAYRRANAEPFAASADRTEPALSHLKLSYERNKEIIRQGVELERQRFSQTGASAETSSRSKTAAR